MFNYLSNKMFIMTLTEYSNQGTDSTAIAVIAFGGGPNLLEKLTLLERFDATSLGRVLKIKYCLFFFKYIYYNLFSNLNFIISFLDKIKFEGCTPLATALISCKRYVEGWYRQEDFPPFYSS